MQLRKLLTSQLGFTMVELLVVISIIGILATAVLAALNPLEQIRKGRDTSRKADAQTLLGAIDRYQATFGCYPWQRTTGTCVTTTGLTADTVTGTRLTGTGASADLAELMAKEELKSQFSTRNTIANEELYLSVDGLGQASICFEPESKSARGGGLGPIRDRVNADLTAGCPAAYGGGMGSSTATTCAVCVPQ